MAAPTASPPPTDPHVRYELLRREAPVSQFTTPAGMTAWLVTRYADARQALADPRLSKDLDKLGPRPMITMDADVRRALDHHMLNADPPDHTRLRKLVAGVFTSRRVAALGPRIAEITDELLTEIDRRVSAGEDTLDLIEAFAFPLPLRVICELLGVPLERRTEFREWSNIIVTGPDAGHDLAAAGRQMIDYILELIEDKRAEPTDDLLTDLINASDGGDRLTEEELVAMVFLLLVAGHETTVNLITNGVFLLLSHPEQLARLRAEPKLLPGAIEEFLRYESPVKTATVRFTTEEVEIGGVTVPPKQIVFISLLSANRDGDHFTEPDTFDVTNSAGRHLAFGHGIHYCVGAPLARLEAKTAFERLLARYDQLGFGVADDQLGWRPGLLMHGLTTLPVRFGRSAV